MAIRRAWPNPGAESGPCSNLRTLVLSSVLLFSLAAHGARAEEVTLRNDSPPANNIQAFFDAGEGAAAWLTSTCKGSITKVQVGWGSASGGSLPTLGGAIRIHGEAVFPTPGTQLHQILGPQLIDNAINEFMVQPSVPIDDGQTIVVTLFFLEATPFPNGPTLLIDGDGCQEDKNAVSALSTWFSPCPFGQLGDYALRAVVDCQETVVLFSDDLETGDTTKWDDKGR